MKSISTMPPAAYFRSQTSSSPFSSAMARRISLTSLAILARKLTRHQATHGMDNTLGDVGEGDACLLGGDCAGQDPRANQEQAFLAEQSQSIKKLFVEIRVRQRRGEAGG